MTLSPADPLLLLAAALAYALARRDPTAAPMARTLATLAALSAVRIVADGAMAHPAAGMRTGLDRVAWAVAMGAHWVWMVAYAAGVVAALRKHP